MKRVAILFLGTLLYGQTIDCTKVFEERKSELLREVEKIDEARQSFEALQAATNALFDKQKLALKEQESAIAKSKQDVEATQSKIAAMVEENKKLLASIDAKKNEKIDETYAKMKDAAAASIIEKLPTSEAAAIMFGLPAKKISQVMAKMNPQIAADVTQRLKLGPPFSENNQTKE